LDILLARSLAELGRSDEARRRLGDIADRLRELPRTGLWLLCASVTAEACAVCGRAEYAGLLLELLEPYAGRVPMVGEFMCLGSVSRPLGALAAILERWDEAEAYFEDALAHAKGLRAPILTALAELERARALARHAQRAQRLRALPWLESATRTARELGLAGVEQQARQIRESIRDARTRKTSTPAPRDPNARIPGAALA
jgi:hypothetical protein